MNNTEYFAQCRDAHSYEALANRLRNWTDDSAAPVAAGHLANRGNYSAYPDRMVTHQKKELFLRCARCNRGHCTDAWAPVGYCTVYDRVRVTEHRHPETWFIEQRVYCLDTNCANV